MIGPLKNLFGGKKENFFLELDDAGGTPDAAPTPAAAVAEAPAAEPAAPAAPPKAAKKVAKKKVAKKKAAKQQPAPQPVAQQPAPAAPSAPAVLFAPNNMVPQSTGKRRSPGPSLDAFKDMAKGMGRR